MRCERPPIVVTGHGTIHWQRSRTDARRHNHVHSTGIRFIVSASAGSLEEFRDCGRAAKRGPHGLQGKVETNPGEDTTYRATRSDQRPADEALVRSEPCLCTSRYSDNSARVWRPGKDDHEFSVSDRSRDPRFLRSRCCDFLRKPPYPEECFRSATSGHNQHSPRVAARVSRRSDSDLAAIPRASHNRLHDSLY